MCCGVIIIELISKFYYYVIFINYDLMQDNDE